MYTGTQVYIYTGTQVQVYRYRYTGTGIQVQAIHVGIDLRGASIRSVTSATHTSCMEVITSIDTRVYTGVGLLIGRGWGGGGVTGWGCTHSA